MEESSPKGRQTTEKTVKGKVYHWCIFHKKWCLHTEDECQIGQKLKEEQAEKEAMDAEVDEGEQLDSENSNTSTIPANFCEHLGSE